MPEQQTSMVDWQQVEGEILCPLCEYNLRGLGEGRCPECGYRFEWADLIDPERRRHPYLFEHHPRRKVWSFAKTAVGGLRPRRFWGALHPTQPSYFGRLIGYWILANLIGLVVPLAILGLHCVEETRAMLANRAIVLAVYNNPAGFPQGPWIKLTFPNQAALDRYLATQFPLPPSPEFFQRVMGVMGERWVAMVSMPLLFGGWPWLTFFTLMIFQASMRQAKVRRIHVLRCVVYCSDVSVWISWGTVGLVGLAALAAVRMAWSGVNLRGAGIDWVYAVAVLAFIFGFAYRLGVAYRRYLRFDHAEATVLASQIIVLLFVPTTLLLIALAV